MQVQVKIGSTMVYEPSLVIKETTQREVELEIEIEVKTKMDSTQCWELGPSGWKENRMESMKLKTKSYQNRASIYVNSLNVPLVGYVCK